MFWNTLKEYTLTENGALTRNTSGSALLDLFSMGGAMRERTEKDITTLFQKALKEDAVYAMKCLFYLRDCRGGAGEKRVFRVITRWLFDNYKEIPQDKYIKLTAEYGSWKDIFSSLTVDEYAPTVLAELREHIKNDTVSMMEKYMPQVSGSKNKQAETLAKKFGLTPKQYRKMLVGLRKKLSLVESKMSQNNWEEIKYEHVPSKAMMNYNKAFGRHDYGRFSQYIQSVNAGKTKINASTTMPYEVYKKLLKGTIDENSANAIWNNLTDYTDGKNAIVVADVSGSMHSPDYTPISVSVSLALYFAERNKGAFNGSFITFSESPEIVSVKGNTLKQKMDNISQANWGMSTNIQSVFNLILSRCISSKVPQSEMPEVIYIISDMEFDSCQRNSFNQTNFEAMKEKYQKSGYAIPRIVFWNVNSHQNNVPVSKNEINTMLVSGASPSAFSYAVEQGMTPMSFMTSVLDADRYKMVENLFG